MVDEYEVYNKVCKDRFDKMERKQDKLEDLMQEVREKVFNGLGARMELNTKLIILMLTVLVLGIGGMILQRFL